MAVLVVDTETTGFPPAKACDNNPADWCRCRIVEVAWSVHDGDGVTLGAASFVIRPDGFFVPERASDVHGITTAKAYKEGIPIGVALVSLHDAITVHGVHRIVGHNLEFDDRVIAAELFRAGRHASLKLWTSLDRYCTLREAPRRLKLAALYESMFGRPPSGVLHRAAADVDVCAQVYFRLTRGISAPPATREAMERFARDISRAIVSGAGGALRIGNDNIKKEITQLGQILERLDALILRLRRTQV